MSLAQQLNDDMHWRSSKTESRRVAVSASTNADLERWRNRVSSFGGAVQPWASRAFGSTFILFFFALWSNATGVEGQGEPALITMMIACAASGIAMQVATAMRATSWWFSIGYWRELWLHETPSQTFGPAFLSGPLRVIGRVGGWTVAVVVASAIEADVNALLETPGPEALGAYTVRLLRTLVPVVGLLYTAALVAWSPFAMRRVHKSDAHFVARHGVKFATWTQLLTRSYGLVVIWTLSLAGVLFLAD